VPVKRRVAKRRGDPAAELEAWSCYFSFGADYFGDLKQRWGLTQDETSLRARIEVKEAWSRLAGAFLETWKGDSYRPRPWAETKLGNPALEYADED
jgi:hypothetical protein